MCNSIDKSDFDANYEIINGEYKDLQLHSILDLAYGLISDEKEKKEVLLQIENDEDAKMTWDGIQYEKNENSFKSKEDHLQYLENLEQNIINRIEEISGIKLPKP